MRNQFSQEELADGIIPKKVVKEKNKVSIRNNALVVYMDTNLTRSEYETIRTYNKSNSVSNLTYPIYKELQKAKKDCYPLNIELSENAVSVNVQSLVDHTVFRLMLSLDEKVLNKINKKEILLKCKWGMDGSSGQQGYKQNFQNKNTSDASVFIVMFVPLQLAYKGRAVWTNHRSNSTRYCRPIYFEFAKETTEYTVKIYNLINDQISKLNQTIIENVRGVSCAINWQFQCTMVDGKTINALTGQRSSSSCNCCGATPTQMNDLRKDREVNEKAFQFGLSPLHCRIRFMECILHIGYNLDFKKGCARGDDKSIKADRKKRIQEELKEKLSLIVDVVKQGKQLIFI